MNYIVHTQHLENYGTDIKPNFKFKIGDKLLIRDVPNVATAMAKAMEISPQGEYFKSYPITIQTVGDWILSITDQDIYKDLLDSIDDIKTMPKKEYHDMEDSFLWQLRIHAIWDGEWHDTRFKGRHDFMHLNNIGNKMLEFYLSIDKRIFNLLYRRANNKWAKMYDSYGRELQSTNK